MANKKVKRTKTNDENLHQPFDFDRAIKVKGPLKKEHLAQARAKVLKSVRYDPDLLEQVQHLAAKEGIPYQTLMNSLLKAGLEARETNLVERVKRLERKIFKKHG